MPEPTSTTMAAEAEPWYGARVVPAGPWTRRAACRAPDVDPTWFTVDEDAAGAAELLAKAKQVCRGCPVRLWCRIHADETGEYGVYAAERPTRSGCAASGPGARRPPTPPPTRR